MEFQKRGLPHAHILIWLENGPRLTVDDIDGLISAEIPNPDSDPILYKAVSKFMIHGPCGPARTNSPCMHENKCTKHFPKPYAARTYFEEDGYCKYKRQDNGVNVVKNGVELDNRWVVPNNRLLLLRYQAHINVEFCNQSRSIKYLFKYVNKGFDKATAALYKQTKSEGEKRVVDEIKYYLECRYVFACEGTWRIFGFVIQYNEPPVYRLNIHLPNQQSVAFEDHESLESVVERASAKMTTLHAWFEANKEHAAAKDLTYAEFPTKFVFNNGVWTIRKYGYSIGRVYSISSNADEQFYLRMLLTIRKGVNSFVELRTIDGTIHESFKDACYAMGLLEDDNEYIEAIHEASIWSSAAYVRRFFAMLVINGSISRPAHVWDCTWENLTDDILIKQRHIMNDLGALLSYNNLSFNIKLYILLDRY